MNNMKNEQEEQESKYEEVYLDANLLIYASIDETEIGGKARKIIEKIKEGRYKAYTASLTFDEIMYAIQKNADREKAIRTAELYIKLQNLNIIPIDTQLIIKSIEVYKKTNLKPRDSIHLTAMISKNLHIIISSDPDFDKIKDIKRIDFTKNET